MGSLGGRLAPQGAAGFLPKGIFDGKNQSEARRTPQAQRILKTAALTGERHFSLSEEFSMLIDFFLPPAGAGVTGRVLQAGTRQASMAASTTCASLVVRAGQTVVLKDDGRQVGTYSVTKDTPRQVKMIPCQPIDVPPTSPSGEQHVQQPVQLVQAVTATVEKTLDKMTPSEKLAAGYKPVPRDGRVVWEKQ